MNDFNGKHILVTGGSRGIGREISRVLLENKANLSLHYRVQKEKALDVLHEFPDCLARIVQADIRDETAVKNMFEYITKEAGRVDGLVVNAGIWPSESVLTGDMNLKQWENTIKVNLTGSFLLVREFFRNLKANPGENASIVLIGSTAGKFGELGHADYSATKSALMYGLARTWKNEIVKYARLGRINVVAPGWTYTDMAAEALEDQALVKRVLQTVPMKKIAKPRDVANIVAFLLNDDLAGHVTGQTIMVDGGMEGRVLNAPEEINMDSII